MNYKSKYLTPHALYKDYTFEQFCKKIPDFYFKKEVPIDVVKNFEVVESLMAHSYYEYRFVDEAYAKALISFEMAMNFRYKDFYPDTKKKLVFNDLIHALTDLNLFDTNIEDLKHLKWTRNQFAHPENHTFAGVIFWNRIEYISRLINEMYEDVELRKERNSLFENFYNKQSELGLFESLVLQKGKEQMPLFRFRLLFINNKQSPSVFTFMCVPLFEIANEEDDHAPVPQIFSLQLIEIEITGNIIIGKEYSTGKNISVSSVHSCEKHLPIFNTWKEKYGKVKRPFLYASGISFHIPELVIPEIQTFQKS